MTRRIGAAISISLAAGAFSLVAALPAAATPTPKDAPLAGDNRATSFPDNVTTCEQAGLGGSVILFAENLTVQYISPTIPAGFQLTGIVVKGGDGYNVYGPGALTDLRAPYNNGGQIPVISHWFACAVKKDAAPPTNPPANPVNPESPADSSAPGASGSATTTTPASQGAVSGAALADTGFSATAPLVGAGALILLGGGLLLALRRTRRRG